MRAQTEAAKAQIEAATNAAKLQSRASVVSASRQRWIDALRDDIAEVRHDRRRDKGFDAQPSSNPKVNLDFDPEKDRLLARQMLLLRRVRLRLNPTEGDHQELVRRMNKLMVTPQLESGKPAEAVIQLTKKILKDEWERVKREANGDVAVSSPSFS